MFFRRAPRWLFLRDNKWINIQVVTNKILIHPGSFISTPRKHINIFSKESQLLFWGGSWTPTWKYLSTSVSIVTFSSFSHLTPSTTRSEDVSISFDCYKALFVVAEDSPSDWCLIAATRHCLAIAWLLINSSTWSPEGYFTIKCKVEETTPMV